jgi:hypothetical protein
MSILAPEWQARRGRVLGLEDGRASTLAAADTLDGPAGTPAPEGAAAADEALAGATTAAGWGATAAAGSAAPEVIG